MYASCTDVSDPLTKAKFDSLLKEVLQWALKFANDEREVTVPYIRFDGALWRRPEFKPTLVKEWTAFVQSDAWKDVNSEVRKAALKIPSAIETTAGWQRSETLRADI